MQRAHEKGGLTRHVDGLAGVELGVDESARSYWRGEKSREGHEVRAREVTLASLQRW